MRRPILSAFLIFVLSGIMSCRTSKETMTGLYRSYGKIGYCYINLSKNLKVPFPVNERFCSNMSLNRLKRVGISASFLDLFKIRDQELLYLTENDVLPVTIRTGSYYPGVYQDFVSLFRQFTSNDPEINNFKELTQLKLPANIDTLKHTVFEYTTIDFRIVEYLIEAEGGVFRLTYAVPSTKEFFNYPHFAKKLSEDFLKDELASIDFRYTTNMNKRFSVSPLMGAHAVFRESNANHLLTTRWIESFETSAAGLSSFQQNDYAQARKLFYSFIGRPVALIAPYGPVQKRTLHFDRRQKYVPEDALSAISDIADTCRVIMLNEAHSDPMCRVVATSILDTLYKKGFRHLMVEALADTLLNIRKYPVQLSGLYTNEPMFSNFLRKAVKVGFKVYPYESEGMPGETPDQREHQQAYNIHAVVSADKDAKVLVYAGHGHINKKIGRMAYIFRKISGINPFCINQAVNDENQESLGAFKKGLTTPSVFYDRLDNTFLVAEEQKKEIDATIVFPEAATKDGFTEWSLKAGNLPFRVRLNGKQFTDKNLQIVRKEEVMGNRLGESVPVINLVLKKKNNFTVYLDSGIYYLQVFDGFKNRVYFKEILL